MGDVVKDIINRAKYSSFYAVKTHVREGWMPIGRIPYDLQITGEDMIVRVLAINETEAVKRVSGWLSEQLEVGNDWRLGYD